IIERGHWGRDYGFEWNGHWHSSSSRDDSGRAGKFRSVEGGVGANQGDPFFGLMEPFSGPTAPFLTVKLRGTIDKRLAILR
ncbi:hypothetical protein, partial [Rhizobium ruizarguesonis]|uniref:hypothetical protein n=1 Tax=Rhizobium ruizarguesonis TaxID=2081791 RepID=UPI001953F694